MAVVGQEKFVYDPKKSYYYYRWALAVPHQLWRRGLSPLLQRLSAAGGTRGAVAAGVLAVLDNVPNEVRNNFIPNEKKSFSLNT